MARWMQPVILLLGFAACMGEDEEGCNFYSGEGCKKAKIQRLPDGRLSLILERFSVRIPDRAFPDGTTFELVLAPAEEGESCGSDIASKLYYFAATEDDEIVEPERVALPIHVRFARKQPLADRSRYRIAVSETVAAETTVFWFGADKIEPKGEAALGRSDFNLSLRIGAGTFYLLRGGATPSEPCTPYDTERVEYSTGALRQDRELIL